MSVDSFEEERASEIDLDARQSGSQTAERLRSRPAEVIRELLGSRMADQVKAAVREATSAAIAETGRGLDFTGGDLSGLDLGGLDLRHATLNRARLDSASLAGADLTDAVMICPLMERTTARAAVLTGVYTHALAAVSSDWSGVRMAGALDTTGALFHGVTLVGADLSGGNYAGATFYQCDLSAADLRGCDLSGATFNECVLRGSDLSTANLAGATITRSNADGLNLAATTGPGLTLQDMTGLRELNLTTARLDDLSIRRGALDKVKAVGAGLHGLRLIDVSMTDCDLSGADLSDASWRGVSGSGNIMRRAQLGSASLSRCRLPRTDLRGASMENARLLESDLSDSRFTNLDDDQGQASFTGRGLSVRDCDLSDSDFTDAYLYRASFTGDPVTGMRLDSALFVGANLIQAYVAAALPHANLTRAQAAYMRFNQSDLTGADLTGASLYQASLVKVTLSDAVLTAVTAPMFLDRCKGMDTVRMDDELRGWLGSLAVALVTRRVGST